MEIDQKTRDIIDDQAHLVHLLKSTFVSKNEMVELLITCAIAQEHLLIVGPPGTAKSELIKRFARLCTGDQPSSNNGSDGSVNYFEYLLTRFTEPNEIFGPVDIASFQQGKGMRRNIQGMLPCAKIVFLD